MSKTLVTERYSRILVPLPPVQSIKDEVGKLVEDEFKVTPEYVETDWCEVMQYPGDLGMVLKIV